MSLKEKFFAITPYFIQDVAITAYNTYQYKVRHGGKYKTFRNYYAKVDAMDSRQLEKEMIKKRDEFFSYIKSHSPWYKSFDFSNLKLLPILNKEDIINNLDEIKTLEEKNGIISLTGGTTGASMKVIYTRSDVQERYAILDHFRAQHGYKLGKKTAWFSGKNLISEKHLSKQMCSNYDFINKIRFYSTFHINQKNFDIYWNSLNDFAPEFIVGFPSSVYEICKIADTQGLRIKTKVKVFFPTAETVLPKHREVIGRVLGCKIVDQYASSEGAPFILECEAGNLHIHPLTGIFEVVDDNILPNSEGKILVTSFTTHGTPLVRYNIGDHIKLAPPNQKCGCGSIFPIVENIEGRSNDYILSPTNGKVNLGNISNSTKNIKGLIKFQLIQNSADKVKLLIVSNNSFTSVEQKKFLEALKERLGSKITVDIDLVDDIPNEKSGKFRIVKNNLK